MPGNAGPTFGRARSRGAFHARGRFPSNLGRSLLCVWPWFCTILGLLTFSDIFTCRLPRRLVVRRVAAGSLAAHAAPSDPLAASVDNGRLRWVLVGFRLRLFASFWSAISHGPNSGRQFSQARGKARNSSRNLGPTWTESIAARVQEPTLQLQQRKVLRCQEPLWLAPYSTLDSTLFVWKKCCSWPGQVLKRMLLRGWLGVNATLHTENI